MPAASWPAIGGEEEYEEKGLMAVRSCWMELLR